MLLATLADHAKRQQCKLIFRQLATLSEGVPLAQAVTEMMTALGDTPDRPRLISIYRPASSDGEGEYLVAVTEGAPGWHYHHGNAIERAGLRCSNYV